MKVWEVTESTPSFSTEFGQTALAHQERAGAGSPFLASHHLMVKVSSVVLVSCMSTWFCVRWVMVF